MAKINVKGTITRLVVADERNDQPEKIFFRAEDPGVLRQIDGKYLAGSGEIVLKQPIAGHKVGDEAAFDVGDE